MGATALSRLNELPPDRAEQELLACCASPVWAQAVATGRPYPDVEMLIAAGRAALAQLSWAQIAQALAAHPRIGARAEGDRQDAAWSRREQAGVDRGDDETLTALAEVNRDYEDRFGHVLLIFASGKTGDEMLDAARERLTHDNATERRVVRQELTKIVELRVERLATAEGAVAG